MYRSHCHLSLEKCHSVSTGVSPWQLFAVEEKQRIALYFNRYQFTAAQDAIAHLPPALPERERRTFDSLAHIIEGYAAWDRFDHRRAAAAIGRGLRDLEPFCAALESSPLKPFCAQVAQNQAFLQSIAKTKEPDTPLVVDLLSNARRRQEEGKYDDGVARLYRALEMIGQIAFRETFACATGGVNPDILPVALRETFKQRYMDERRRTLQLPLSATFQALKETGHAAGQAYASAEQELGALLLARNGSILAHGNTPVDAETFERLDTLIRTHFDLPDAVPFPRLEW